MSNAAPYDLRLTTTYMSHAAGVSEKEGYGCFIACLTIEDHTTTIMSLFGQIQFLMPLLITHI
jgi:hypothetical protein